MNFRNNLKNKLNQTQRIENLGLIDIHNNKRGDLYIMYKVDLNKHNLYNNNNNNFSKSTQKNKWSLTKYYFKWKIESDKKEFLNLPIKK